MNQRTARGLLHLGLAQNGTSSNGNDLGFLLQRHGVVGVGILSLIKECAYAFFLMSDGISFDVDGVRYNLEFREEPLYNLKYTWKLTNENGDPLTDPELNLLRRKYGRSRASLCEVVA